ncbi:peptide-methionine (S)-S-oxide reductase MsrA [Lichenicola sp.]|uniref:peptide-methionine (S)-S-oxide reductase MsrA n=1 Tax=Lichenicola sp. TaxID=2804529 RepID=UPI003B00D9D4
MSDRDAAPSIEPGRHAAVLGGGCFWCLDAVYRDLHGVIDVQPGYAGGDDPAPGYEAVCSGRTGHAEVVRIEYEPALVSYADLLRVFFTIHDPTTLNRQGADVGSQYRSVVFTSVADERAVAGSVMREIAGAGLWDGPIGTEISPLPLFHPAEAEHHDYHARHPEAGYCRVVIAPKLARFRMQFPGLLKAPGARAASRELQPSSSSRKNWSASSSKSNSSA